MGFRALGGLGFRALGGLGFRVLGGFRVWGARGFRVYRGLGGLGGLGFRPQSTQTAYYIVGFVGVWAQRICRIWADLGLIAELPKDLKLMGSNI